MKIKSYIIFNFFLVTSCFGQWYASMTNPNVKVTVTHPPSLMLKIERLAFYPQYDSSSQELTDYLITHFVNGREIEVIDRQHLNQILMEQNLAISGRINPATAARLGELLGPAAFVFVKVYRDNHEKKHLTETYKSNEEEKIKYISKITVNFKVSFQTTDLTTGRIFSAKIFEKTRSRENVNYEGYPEYPSVEQLRAELFKEATIQVSHFFLAWDEVLNPVFFNDKKYGMKNAYMALSTGNLEEALRLSKESVNMADSDRGAKAKFKSRTYYNLGMCYFLMYSYDKAIDNFSKAYLIKDYNMYKTAINNARDAKQYAIDLLRVEEMSAVGNDNGTVEVSSQQHDDQASDEQFNSVEDELEAKLEKLKKYYEKGLITEEEYQEKRKELLKKLL